VNGKAVTDDDFFQRIDCRFPYGNLAEASMLIEEARSISGDACFAVLEEICRRPRSTNVSQERQHQLLSLWAQAVDHPLKEEVVPFALALVNGSRIPAATCAAAMKAVSNYSGQWSALSIIYFAVSDEDDRASAEIEELNTVIRAAWQESDR
jgi:hypothetical protein